MAGVLQIEINSVANACFKLRRDDLFSCRVGRPRIMPHLDTRNRPACLGLGRARLAKSFVSNAGKESNRNDNGGGRDENDNIFQQLDVFAGGLLLGLLITGQLNLFEGPIQFIFGSLLILFVGGGLLIRVFESVIDSDEEGSIATSGNCPWCGNSQKVLNMLSEFRGTSVPQQCISCSKTFVVKDGVFVRTAPMFDEYTFSSRVKNKGQKKKAEKGTAGNESVIIDVESIDK